MRDVRPDPSPRRRRRRWLVNGWTVAIVIAVLGAGGLVRAANHVLDEPDTVPVVAPVLVPSGGAVENYLLVGSDSREGLDPSAPDAGGFGTTEDVQGRRSDTVMVLRYDTESGDVALLSLPRDLWVDIPGTGPSRLNSAYSAGPEVLVRTVEEALGLPVHHYIEVDFHGFKDIVDAVGGVEVCFDAPTRDRNTGLDVPAAGCYVLDGAQGLAYARSRYYETLVDGEWQTDPTSDLGRTERQRAFVQATLDAALDRMVSDPFQAAAVAEAATAALRTDPDLDLVELGSRLRPVADGGIDSYALPVRGETVGGKAVLLLADGAEAVLQYFRGAGPAPAPAP